MNYKFAEDISKDDSLLGLGQPSSISKISFMGKFSPKTKANNFFVYLNDSTNEKVLAHCFAHIRNPTLYEVPVDMIESVWNYFIAKESIKKVHPSHEWMRQTFTFLQEWLPKNILIKS